MVRLIRILLSALVVSGLAHGAQNIEPAEVLVKFRPGYGNGQLAHAQIRAVVTQVLPRIAVQVVALPTGMSVEHGLEYYRGRADVEFAEPNYSRELQSAPNDPLYPQQYGLQMIHAAEGWDLATGAPGTIVAVIDTGIDLQHEDLHNKIVPGFDFSDNDSNPTAYNDHGVHVSGIVAADTNNLKGIAGVGYNCRIMPLKIFPHANVSTSSSAIIYAADHGAKAICMSYGSSSSSSTEASAVSYAWSKGVVLVSSAGNNNNSVKLYPAGYPAVISVGSTGPTDGKSDFSNFGSWVSVAAPGENILSTVTGGYALMSGTSMSCPHVAGLAALLSAFAPAGTPAQDIRNAIEQTTDPVGSWLSHGRINVRHALDVFNPGPVIGADPIAVDPYVGSAPSGNVASLLFSDSDSFTIQSAVLNLGQAAGVVVTFGVDQPVINLHTANLVLEENGPVQAANQVFLWNFGANRYDLIRSTPLRPSGTNHQIVRLPNTLTAYVQGGQMKMLTRAIWVHRPYGGAANQPVPFQLGVNYAQLRTQS